MPSQKTWKALATWSKRIGLTRICYILNRSRKRILVYHNVIPDEFYDDKPHLSHSIKESIFTNQLDIIRRKFAFGLEVTDPEKITITFDDGYLNQYSIAAKSLDECNIKGYFFCAADLMIVKNILDIDKLQYWFSYVPSGEYTINLLEPIKLEIRQEADRMISMKKILPLIKSNISMNQIEIALNEAYRFSDIRGMNQAYYNLRFTPILEDDILKMKKNGHRIGAHSASHSIMSRLSEKELRDELLFCSNMLEDIYNTDIFSFPFGGENDVNNKVIEEVSRFGFNGGLAYTNAPINGELKYNKYFMPRMALPNTDDEDIINFVLSGAMHFIVYRGLLPKW